MFLIEEKENPKAKNFFYFCKMDNQIPCQLCKNSHFGVLTLQTFVTRYVYMCVLVSTGLQARYNARLSYLVVQYILSESAQDKSSLTRNFVKQTYHRITIMFRLSTFIFAILVYLHVFSLLVRYPSMNLRAIN